MIKKLILILKVLLLAILLYINKPCKENFESLNLNNKNIYHNYNNLERSYQEDKNINNIKVAIVSMVSKQPDFEYWLHYHLEVLGIDHIFLRIEDCPEYKELIDKYPNKITAQFHNKEDIDTKHNYLTIMDRQKENVNNGIKLCKKKRIDYVFHTDADELIFVEEIFGKNKNQSLKIHLESAPKNFDCIHFKNFEAVFPNSQNKCFNTNKFIDCKKGSCLSYANGKSVGRVKNNIRFHGPHYFTGEVFDMPDNKISVLHFDSCTYKQWETKFDLLKDTNEEKMKKIPFPFYKNSINKLKKCGGENKKEISCKNELEQYYKTQKIDSYFSKKTRKFNFDNNA